MSKYVGLTLGVDGDGDVRCEEIDNSDNDSFPTLDKAKKAIESYVRRTSFTGRAVVVNFETFTVVARVDLDDSPLTLPWK